MRIAILTYLFPPKWLAGTEIATYNIAKHLSKGGHEIHVITTLGSGLLKEEVMGERFYVHRVRIIKTQVLGFLLYSVKALFAIRRINPHLVHVQAISTVLPAFLSKIFLKIPYIVWGQGSDVYISWKLRKIFLRLILKNADAMIALTNDMKREIKKYYNKDIIVIPNGINLERFNISRVSSREKLGINPREKIILFVGRLHPIKGVKYLIEAMHTIEQKDKNARLLLVGGGGERQNLKKLVKKLKLEKSINFVGKIPNERVPIYMVASDIFVLPSLSEGFPIASIEAMASGLPIIATDVGGLPEVVEDSKNGFLVRPMDAKAIAEKAILLLRNNRLREKISKINKKKASRYPWGDVVKKLEDVYLRVACPR